MSPRGSSRVISCTPAEARARREQAKAFIDVAEMVLSEPATQTHSHVVVVKMVPPRTTPPRTGTPARVDRRFSEPAGPL